MPPRDRGRADGRRYVSEWRAGPLVALLMEGRAEEAKNGILVAAYEGAAAVLGEPGPVEDGEAYLCGFIEGADAAFSGLIVRVLPVAVA